MKEAGKKSLVRIMIVLLGQVLRNMGDRIAVFDNVLGDLLEPLLILAEHARASDVQDRGEHIFAQP